MNNQQEIQSRINKLNIFLKKSFSSNPINTSFLNLAQGELQQIVKLVSPLESYTETLIEVQDSGIFKEAFAKINEIQNS